MHWSISTRRNHENSKLRTYANYKSTGKLEIYLAESKLSWYQKQAITKLRLGDHKLHIETGRSKPKLPLDKRICNICCTNVLEDEKHFLIDCTSYYLLMKKYNISPSFVHNMISDNNDNWSNLAGYIKEAFLLRANIPCNHR